MSIKSITSLILALALTGPHMVQAQDAQALDLMLRQQGVTQSQLQDLIQAPSAAGQAFGDGIPTAETTNSANLINIENNPDLLVQSVGAASDADSVVQRYFRILTGETLEIYGAQEFSQQQDNQLLFFNTMGKNYRVAPGDVLRVTLRGLSQKDLTLQIGRDGNLILPDLPPLAVSGQTLSEIEDRLLEILQYDDAAATVFLSLETARLITVQVSGAVNAPRTLAVPAYTPLSRVLAYAGGVKPTGSLRTIVLRDRDGSSAEVDFYDFLQSPFGANDPLVTDASRVFVPNQGPTVAAVGFVARPGIYELPNGITSVPVRELLELSGTQILPPGLAVEALYFDDAGISQTRDVTLDDSLSAGEVLNLRFVQTRLQDAVTVVGAVLDQYSMATGKDIAVADLLKDGATLQPNARLDFALILTPDGRARAINLLDALNTPNVVIPQGATLVIFDQDSYRKLVTADPNATNDPLVAAISQADVAELYLNGERIALIPPSANRPFAELLRPYYRTTPATNLDLAILEDPEGYPRALSLRSLLQSEGDFLYPAGLKVHLFETPYLTKFVRELDGKTTPDNPTFVSELGQNAPLARLLANSGVVRVTLDGELRSILPAITSQTIAQILDVLGIQQSYTALADLVEVQTLSDLGLPQTQGYSLNQDYRSELPIAQSVNFWSDQKFNDLSSSFSSSELDALLKLGVAIYIDNSLHDIVSASTFNNGVSNSSRDLLSPDIYPLFSVHKSFHPTLRTWLTQPLRPYDLFEVGSTKITAGDELFLFTNGFIKSLMRPKDTSSDAAQLVQAQQNAVGTDQLLNPVDNTQTRGVIDVTTRIEQQVQDSFNTDTNSNGSSTRVRDGFEAALFTSNARFIGGAVVDPGLYPITGSIDLQQLLAVAGGTLNTADLTNIRIQYLTEANGSLTLGDAHEIDLRNNSALTMTLAGRYYVNVPFLIDEATTGIVTLTGEVMRPGDYVISRGDTLHDVIERAGGLSPVAYPLGAVFTRESLIESERDINDLLATQLEQTVLSIADSGKDGAADQIRAVLGYASQLRSQTPIGRMSVNVTYANPEAPVFLQTGDHLVIPKRPSHITIIGAVNRNTTASYEPNKPLSAYLSAAGGTTRVADMRSTYMLLPNGESTQLDSSTPIPPGAAIVVPPRTDRLTALGVTDLVSRVLGNIATSILAINNVK